MTKKTMSKKTKEILHECYFQALKLGARAVKDTVVLEYFIMKLQEALHSVVPEDDLKEFSAFLEGVKVSLKKRLHKEDVRRFVIEATTVLKDIQEWLAETQGIHSNILYVIREKPLESELMKIFNKVQSYDRVAVKDRNSMSIIFLDNDLDIMYTVHNYMVGILTGLNQKAREEFMKWLITNEKKSHQHSLRVLNILEFQSISLEQKGKMHGTKGFIKDEHPELEVPAKTGSDYIEFFKDYYVEPKANSYQGLQGVLIWEDTNLFLEQIFVLASSKDRNDYGKASHIMHKIAEVNKASVDECQPIFRLKPSELAELRMDNFSGYQFEKADRLHLFFEDEYYKETKCA